MDAADVGEVAAVDLGSNSFHLVIARSRGDEVTILDRVREPVRLARGLGDGGGLQKKTAERALGCLRRFRQRLTHVAPSRVRAVGTSTLRRLRDKGTFLASAEEALGHSVDVISGGEEARLIYLGVAHSLANQPGSRLVVDIGGGSTECILGERFEPFEVHSLAVGCVQLTNAYFPKGVITREAYREARLAAEQEFTSIERTFREAGWDSAAGSSGTIRATERIMRENGWSEGGITPAGIKKLRKAITAAKHVRELGIPGLKSERAAVFPGGFAIVDALFRRLHVAQMAPSSGALREGALYDLLGRIRHEDVRERTIRLFQERYRVDRAQAARVERKALALLSHSPPEWGLDPTEDGRLLAWAARLHEIGLTVAYPKYHRHGGYLVAHADMPGFSRDDQQMLAAIIACHRRKIDPAALEDVLPARRQRTIHLLLLLRLAVLLLRSRSPAPLPPFRLEMQDGAAHFLHPARWLAGHPLTHRDLLAERAHWQTLGVRLEIGPLAPPAP